MVEWRRQPNSLRSTLNDGMSKSLLLDNPNYIHKYFATTME